MQQIWRVFRKYKAASVSLHLEGKWSKVRQGPITRRQRPPG
jgi:hypothetical protein